MTNKISERELLRNQNYLDIFLRIERLEKKIKEEEEDKESNYLIRHGIIIGFIFGFFVSLVLLIFFI